MTGRRNGAHTDDLRIKEMKAYCKANGCTINDYTTSLLSLTMHDYFKVYET